MKHLSMAVGLSTVVVGCMAPVDEPAEGDVRQADQRAISPDVFDCRDKDGAEGLLCELVLSRVNQELDTRGLTIDRDGLLFTYDNPDDLKIDTGHSCSVTAKVTHRHAEARISSSSTLDVRGDAIREPIAVRLNVPVSFSASARVKQRFGTRFLGSCSNYASDSYTFEGSASATADVLAAIALNPSFGRTSDGDLALMLHPAATVATELDDPNVNFRVSGVSPITPAWTWVAGFSSTLARATTAAFTGDSIGDVFKSTAAWDWGVPIGLTLLGGPAQDLIWNLVEKRVEITAQRKAQHFGSELQDSLNAQLRRALRTDSRGVRTFVIDPNYAALLQAGGLLDDVLVDAPINARQECHDSLNSLCNSCMGCGECIQGHYECDRLPTTTITETSPIPTRPEDPPSEENDDPESFPKPASGTKVCEFNDPSTGTTPGCVSRGVGGGGGTIAYEITKNGVVLMHVSMHTDPYSSFGSCSLGGSGTDYRVSGTCDNYRIYAK